MIEKLKKINGIDKVTNKILICRANYELKSK